MEVKTGVLVIKTGFSGEVPGWRGQEVVDLNRPHQGNSPNTL